MLLKSVKEEKGLIKSEWATTYPILWERVLKSLAYSYEFFSNLEVFVGEKKVKVDSKDDFKKIKENSYVTIKGTTDLLLETPLEITFVNKTHKVVVKTHKATSGKFSKASYKSTNLALGSYLSGLELAMYRDWEED